MQNYDSSDRSAVENAKAEVAALQVKTEHLTTKLREKELENDSNVTRIRDLKTNLEQSKGSFNKFKALYILISTFSTTLHLSNPENEARLSAHVESLKDRLKDIESSQGNLNVEKTRAESMIKQLQDEKRSSEEKVRELEGRLRVYLQERESAEVKAGSWEKRYQESLVILRSALGVDYNESIDTMKVSN